MGFFENLLFGIFLVKENGKEENEQYDEVELEWGSDMLLII